MSEDAVAGEGLAGVEELGEGADGLLAGVAGCAYDEDGGCHDGEII